MKCSIVIPNYNGREFLKKYLPSVLHSLRENDEIVVVDDGSTDDSVDLLSQEFPSVNILALKTNQGFQNACNQGFLAARNDYVILLNNDVEVKSDFIEPLIKSLKDPDVFAASPCILNPSRNIINSFISFEHKSNKYDPDSIKDRKSELDLVNEAFIDLKFKNGLFVLTQPGNSKKALENYKKYNFLINACGGAAAFRRQDFLDLGGFNLLYHPIYWEDIDLSYRAWKSGKKIIYVPESIVYHQVSATFKNILQQKQKDILTERNRFIFTWSNLTDRSLFISHWSWLPLHLTLAIFNGNWIFINGFYQALKKFPRIVIHRKEFKKYLIRRDAEVLALIS